MIKLVLLHLFRLQEELTKVEAKLAGYEQILQKERYNINALVDNISHSVLPSYIEVQWL